MKNITDKIWFNLPKLKMHIYFEIIQYYWVLSDYDGCDMTARLKVEPQKQSAELAIFIAANIC